MTAVNETNAKQHNSKYPLPNDVLVEIIKDMLSPGNIPLGIPFGWIQPDENDTITLGNIYASGCNENTWSEIINAYPGDNHYSIIRMIKQAKRDKSISDFRDYLENKSLNLDSTFECEEIKTSFSKLYPGEKLLYRLSILNLNTMSTGHNFACEYLLCLASNHCDSNGYESSRESGFKLYENDRNSKNIEILGNILDIFENRLSFYIGDYDFSTSGHLESLENDTSQDILDYIQDKENVYDETYENDILELVSGETIPTYDRELPLALMAFSISEIKKAYIEGSFFFTGIPDNLEKKTTLYQFLYTYFNQLTLDL